MKASKDIFQDGIFHKKTGDLESPCNTHFGYFICLYTGNILLFEIISCLLKEVDSTDNIKVFVLPAPLGQEFRPSLLQDQNYQLNGHHKTLAKFLKFLNGHQNKIPSCLKVKSNFCAMLFLITRTPLVLIV